MKIIKNKIAVAIAIFLMLSIAISPTMLMSTKAQFPTEYETHLLLSANPSPVGVGQIVYINPFFTQPMPTAGGMRGDLYEGLTVVITKPDGTKLTLGPYTCDATGGTFTNFTPDVTGNYTIQAFYPGQTLKGWNSVYSVPIGPPYDTVSIGSKMLPSESAIIPITVQQDPIAAKYSTPALPTEYWNRPVYATNWLWGPIAANYLGVPVLYNSTTTATNTLFGTAPNSGHILWTKPTAFGGQPGAPLESNQETQYFSTANLIEYWNTPKILNGVLYYENRDEYGTVRNWTAVDLRTGETQWTRTAGETGTETIAAAQLFYWHTLQEYGAFSTLWTFSGTNYRIYDAKTGIYLTRIENATSALNVMDFDCNEKGTFLGYYTTTNSSGTYLNQWNSTQCLVYYLGRGFLYMPGSVNYVQSYRLSQQAYDFKRGLDWTVKLDTTAPTSISVRTGNVILFSQIQTRALLRSSGYLVSAAYDAHTGAKLWGPLNQTLPKDEDLSIQCYDDNAFVICSKTTDQAWGYSMKTGQQIWGPIQLAGNAESHLQITGGTAKGIGYTCDFGGYVNAINLQTGKLVWSFTRGSSGYDTPYGIYPMWYFSMDAICDGKVYVKEGHQYNPPFFPAKMLCINATTGELIWSILFHGEKAPTAIADGMITTWNSMDKQIYTFGKGPTETDVSVQDDAITLGSQVLIKGMVTDKSSGTQQYALTARFPHGVPAIADKDMSAWMEYVYMQQNKPSNATGVEVAINAIDSNGNYREIGKTTSSSDGFFSLPWTPDIPGEYKIYATFDGSESYFGSNAQTAFVVASPSEATVAPNPIQQAPLSETYFVPAIAVIVVVMLIGFASIIMLMQRRRL